MRSSESSSELNAVNNGAQRGESRRNGEASGCNLLKLKAENLCRILASRMATIHDMLFHFLSLQLSQVTHQGKPAEANGCWEMGQLVRIRNDS